MKNIVDEIALNHMDASEDYYRTNAVYCFNLADERNGDRIYMPCNCRYKPINVNTYQYVEYEPYMRSHGVIFTSDPSKLDVWVSGSHEGAYYLYDSPANRADYAVRMRVVLPHLRPYASVI